MPRFQSRLVTFSAFALLGLSHVARAQFTYTFFPNDATINYVINTDNTIVGYASGTFFNFKGRSSLTVSIVDGGVNYHMYAYNSSTVNIKGGSTIDVNATNRSRVNMSGGDVGILFASNSGTINFSGGKIGGLTAYNQSTINVSGGRNSGSLNASDSSTVNITGIVPPMSWTVGGRNQVSFWSAKSPLFRFVRQRKRSPGFGIGAIDECAPDCRISESDLTPLALLQPSRNRAGRLPHT